MRRKTVDLRGRLLLLQLQAAAGDAPVTNNYSAEEARQRGAEHKGFWRREKGGESGGGGFDM